ncbi:ATP-grasp domain-containing protein [Micromonospora sp. NPDC049275]|uniref:ATP-grasp domain-containing protein n=1 Tax=Micromonospora sp. NPDC049275 TaxID=3364268 RepID=UPI003717B04F
MQLPTFTVPVGLQADHLHAGPTFADAVAARLGIAPLEAPHDWLAGLPRQFTHREVTLVTIGDAYELRRPAFIKSPNDKNIQAMIYTDGSRLPGPDAVDRRTPVLVSDIVGFTAEYRLHLLDGTVHAASQYAEQGRLRLGPPSADALAFGADLRAVQQPREASGRDLRRHHRGPDLPRQSSSGTSPGYAFRRISSSRARWGGST